MPVAVTTEQFELRGARLVHKPTGAEFAISAEGVVSFGWGLAGQPLADGSAYDPADIKQVAHDIARAEQKACL